jgi:type IX secretion system PorP/SprF family membrane protein
MQKIKIYILISVALFFNAITCKAQDFTFSQFYEMPLLRNPAIAGIFSGDVRIQTAFRNQWASVTTPFQTTALSAEVKFPVGIANDYFTGALQVTSDIAGDSKLGRIQILPAFNYLKSLNDENSYIAAGFMGGFVQSSFDPAGLTFDDQFQNGQFNPNNVTAQTFKNTNHTYFDAAAGISYSGMIGYGTKFYVGGAMYHFNKPKVSFFDDDLRLKPRTVINAGLNIPTGDVNNFYIYGDYIVQGGHRQALMGMMYSLILGDYVEDDKVSISFGTFYRWGDALVPVTKLEYHRLSIGLSYDANISKLSAASHYRGGFELTASFKSFLNIRNSSRDKVKCPVQF